MLKKIFLVIYLLGTVLSASDIEVSGAYVRAVPPSTPISVLFMKIINHTNKPLFLESVNSNIAKNIQFHKSIMINSMMMMKAVEKIKIPANGFIELKPGGYHVMLIGLNKKLKIGESIDSMTLKFANNTTIKITNVPVKSVMMGMKNMKHLTK